jgi:hypothetical protein
MSTASTRSSRSRCSLVVELAGLDEAALGIDVAVLGGALPREEDERDRSDMAGMWMVAAPYQAAAAVDLALVGTGRPCRWFAEEGGAQKRGGNQSTADDQEEMQ